MTTGEKAAMSKTATPDAIQFSVVSLSADETNASTTSRNPTYTAVATTNLESRSPTRNSDSVVVALARRGQMDITLTRGTKTVMVRTRAERRRSARWTAAGRRGGVGSV